MAKALEIAAARLRVNGRQECDILIEAMGSTQKLVNDTLDADHEIKKADIDKTLRPLVEGINKTLDKLIKKYPGIKLDQYNLRRNGSFVSEHDPERVDPKKAAVEAVTNAEYTRAGHGGYGNKQAAQIRLRADHRLKEHVKDIKRLKKRGLGKAFDDNCLLLLNQIDEFTQVFKRAFVTNEEVLGLSVGALAPEDTDNPDKIMEAVDKNLK
jgi:hypothetical protein